MTATIRLGTTGLQVSRLCLGTMTFGTQADAAESLRIMDTAAEAGVNFIDTANVYPLGVDHKDKGRTEEIIGGWLKGRRERFVLATKCAHPMGALPWETGTSRKHILSAVDASLKRLGTDYVDLYQLHRDDETTPLDETLEALDTVVRSGRARYVGVSNWPAWRLARALGRSEARGLFRIATAQPRYNLIYRQLERDLFPLVQQEGLGTLCFNPLAGGLLTGKHRDPKSPDAQSRFGFGKASVTYRERYWHEQQFAAVDKVLALAQACGLRPERLAVAWVLAQPGVSCAIVGATRAVQLPEVLAAAQTRLDDDVLARLDAITREFRQGEETI
jgi:1-deoxyxylulose-5-phosphate synthase